MWQGKSTLERAFEVARSGNAKSLQDVQKTLEHEGYWDVRAQLSGIGIRRDLKRLWQATDKNAD